MSAKLRLLIGLGNPGAKYHGTRHNIGFEIVTAWANKYNLEFKLEKKFKSQITIANLNFKISRGTKNNLVDSCEEFRLILALPQTFMNESGTAVQKLMAFYRIKPEDMIIVHDDVSLETADLRLSFDRGAGGQHGVEDIIEKLNNKAFWRLRFGVGPDPGGDQRGDYVLGKFSVTQNELIDTAINDSVELLTKAIVGGDLQQLRSVVLADF